MDQGYGSCSIMGYGSGYGSWNMDRVWARDLDPCFIFIQISSDPSWPWTLASTTPPEWLQPAAQSALQRLEVIQEHRYHLAYSMLCVFANMSAESSNVFCVFSMRNEKLLARSSCHQNLFGPTEPGQPRQASCPGTPSPAFASAPWSHHELEPIEDLPETESFHSIAARTTAHSWSPCFDSTAPPSWIFWLRICKVVLLPRLSGSSPPVLQPLEPWCAAGGCRWRGPSNQPNSILEGLCRSMPSAGLLQGQNAKHRGYSCADCSRRIVPARASKQCSSPSLWTCCGRFLSPFEDLLSVWQVQWS